MSKTVELHEMDEKLDQLIKEAEEWCTAQIEERKKKLAEVEDLYQGKTTEVEVDLLSDIHRDQNYQIVTKLSLRDVLLFSGQGRPLTHKEKVRLGML